MAKAIRICKVCGCEYPYCKTENRGNRFRYQDVACCPEHGAIYFKQIEESRNHSATNNREVAPSDAASDTPLTYPDLHDIYIDDDEEYDEDDDGDYEDDDEDDE